MLKVNAHGIQGDSEVFKTGYLVITNGYASTNPIATAHQSCINIYN